MIAVIGLLLGIAAGLLFEPSVPEGLQPYLPIAVVAALDAVFGALRAYLDGIFDDRVFVISFVSNVLDRRPDRLPRRPARRRRPALDRRHRRPRHPHLLQRRSDQAACLPCLTSRSPTPPARAASLLTPRREVAVAPELRDLEPPGRPRPDHRRRPARSARLRGGRPGAADPHRRGLLRPAARGADPAARLAVGGRRPGADPDRRAGGDPARAAVELGAPAGRARGGPAAARGAADPGRDGAGDRPRSHDHHRRPRRRRHGRRRSDQRASASCARQGAEAIEINDSVRVVASTSFTTDAEGVISADGVELRPPYVIDAIGSADTLSRALDFPGGLQRAVVEKAGGHLQVDESNSVEVELVARRRTG